MQLVCKTIAMLVLALSPVSPCQVKQDAPKGGVWISLTVTGGITGGSRRLVIHTSGEVLELQMSPGKEKSTPLGKLDETDRKELTNAIADMPRFVAPEKDNGKVVDGQTFEIRVKDDQKALWYTATPDTPERVKKLSSWLTELPGKMKKDK